MGYYIVIITYQQLNIMMGKKCGIKMVNDTVIMTYQRLNVMMVQKNGGKII